MENNLSTTARLNEILIRRRRMVILPNIPYDTVITSISNDNILNAPDNIKATIGAIVKNMETYGYNLTLDVISFITFATETHLSHWFKDEIEPALAYITGGNHQYRCMYPNFPEQVMSMLDVELFFNALIHYATLGEWLPEYEAAERKVPIWRGEIKNTLGGLTSEGLSNHLFNIMTELATAGISWSDQDKEDYKFLYDYVMTNYYDKAKKYIDNLSIPNKENLCIIVTLTERMDLLKTATDVLRYITYLSDGDVSLAENTRFKNIKRSTRKQIMKTLNTMNPTSVMEDMWRYRERWIRVGERIHPNRFDKLMFSNVRDAFDSIRSGKKPLFFNAKLNNLINDIHEEKYQYMSELIRTLKWRPGEFARKLDYVLRWLPASQAKTIVEAFNDSATSVAIPVLFQVANHFKIRNDIDDRVIIPKGLVTKATVIENRLPRIRQEICDSVILSCTYAIQDQLKLRDSLGKVYVDADDFINMNAPFALRSASSGNKVLIRGSRMPVGETDVIRLFTWWTNMADADDYYESRVDVDLSMCVFDENWKNLGHISYTNLRDAEIKCCHSGDITNGGEYGGKGVAEFIDINLRDVEVAAGKHKFYGARYLAFNVYSFTGQTFNKFPCCFGWMKRDAVDAKDGKTFDASTVDIRIDLNMKSKSCVPAVYDIKTQQIIWMDLAISVDNIKPINIESNSSRVAEAINAIVNLKKTTMLDVIKANLCRATEIVNNRNEADIIFSLDTTLPTDEDGNIKEDVRIISPYDIDYFIGELM